MNKIIGIVLVLLSITLSGVSGYLFFKAEKTSEDNHVLNNIENIYALQKIDAAWSLATLKTLSVVESDFDQVAAFLPKFHELRNKLSNSELASSQSPAPLKNKLLAFLSMLGGKEHAIEQFKSNLAVVRNSKKYLPLASDLLAEKIKRITDKDLASRIVLINDQVNAYLAAPNADERIKLLEELAELDKSLMGFPQDLVNPLSNYIAHAKVLTERKEPMDRIVTRVTDDSVAKAGIELIVLYKGYVEKRSIVLEDERTLNNIFVLLVAILLSIIAIISGVYVISSANKYNRQLQQEVDARTSDLERQANAATESVVQGHQGKNTDNMNALVATLAHEINTPLGYVGSNLEVLNEGVGKFNYLMEEFDVLNSLTDEPDENKMRSRIKALSNAVNSTREEAMLDEFPGAVKDISDGIKQIQHVVEELKNFSRKDRLDKELFNFNQCVESALKMSSHQTGNNINIIKSLNNVPETYGSQADINQVLINLISNASLAIEESGRAKGTIKISTSSIKNHIVLDVQDNGNGMEKSVSDKIFDPFFTTRDVGKGTGLGLAIVQKIIRQNNGKVIVKSEVGKGTIFRVTFPVTSQENKM